MITIAGGILLALLVLALLPVIATVLCWAIGAAAIGAAIGLAIAAVIWVPIEILTGVGLIGIVCWAIVLRRG